MIEKYFEYLSCKIDHKNVLTCIGWLQPDGAKEKYKVKIESVAGQEPKTTILYPVIEPSVHIHMYDDHSLCLSYKLDMHWTSKINIHQYTIPWISEWIVFYELYLVNGNIWEGRESPFHLKESDKNVNSDSN